MEHTSRAIWRPSAVIPALRSGARAVSVAFWPGPYGPPAQRWARPIATYVALFTLALLQLLRHVGDATGADFRAMLRGATDLASGRDLYAPALHFLDAGHLRQILTMPVTPYVYPPLLAIVLRPFTLIPPGAALVLWDAANVSLLAVLFVLVVRISQARTWRELTLVSAIYGFFPLNMGLGTGQVDVTITLLGLVSYLLYRGGRFGKAGMVLGVMVLIKPTVGILLVFFLFRRAWPVITSCFCTLVAGVGVSLAAVGGKVLWEYRAVAAGWANLFGVLPLNQSLHGLILRLLAPRLDAVPSGTAGLAALAAEALLPIFAILFIAQLLGAHEPRKLRDGALQFYAVFSILLLALPFTEDTHMGWLLPGVGLLFVTMAQQTAWRPWHAWAVTAYLLLALPFAEMVSWQATATPLGKIASSLGCYALLALCAVWCTVAFPYAPGTRAALLVARGRTSRRQAA